MADEFRTSMSFSKVAAVWFALMMLLAPVAGATGSAMAASPSSVDGGEVVAQTTTAPVNGGFTNATEEVSIYDRAVLPLQLDRRGGDVVGTSTESFNTFVKSPADGERLLRSSANRSLVVYNATGTVDLSFDLDRAGGGDLDGDNIHLITARATSSEDPTLPSLTNIQEIGDFVDQEADNENIIFENASTKEVTDGTASFEYDFSGRSGAYVFMAVRTDSGSGVSVSDGDIAVDGHVSVLGADTAFAQQTASEITVDNEEAIGDNISFEVDANLQTDDNRVEHVVALWNESDVSGETITIVAPDEINSTTTASDFAINHTVETVSGVQNVEDDVSAFGRTLDTNRRAGVFELADIVTFVANEGEFGEPETNRVGTSTLNASMTAVNATSSSETITVETLDSFEPGEYVAVHMAVADGNLTKISSSRTNISLVEQADTEPEPEPDNVFINGTSVNDSEVATGESVGVSVDIENPTTDTKTVTVEVSDGQNVLDSEEILINPGNESFTPLSAAFDVDESKTLTITAKVDGNVVDTQTVDITVLSPVERSFNVRDTTVDVGENVLVDVNLTNNRRTQADIPYTITGAPDSVDSDRSILVEGEDTESETLEFSYNSPGERTISLSNLSDTQTVNVGKDTVGLRVIVDSDDPTPGQNVTFIVERTDTGDPVDGIDLTFERIDSGESVRTEADVSSGFTTSFDAAGEYRVTATDARDRDTVDFTSDSAEFTVFERADISILDASTPFDSVIASTEFVTNLDVENTGGVSGDQTFRLVAENGTGTEVLTTETITIEPGETDESLFGSIQPTGTEIPENRTLAVQRVAGTGEDRSVQQEVEVGTVEVTSALAATRVIPQKEIVNVDDSLNIEVTVTNEGTAALRDEFSSQDVTLSIDGQTETKTFAPNPGSAVTQTYTFDNFQEAGLKDLTIEQDFVETITEPNLINVTEEETVDVELTANETSQVEGSPVSFTVTSDESDNVDATLEVVSVDTEDVIDTADTVNGEATITIGEPGTYQVRTTDHDLEVSGDPIIDPGRVTIDVQERGDLEVIDASVVTSEVARTGNADIRATVINQGDTEATETVSLVGRENSEASESVTLDGGERRVIVLSTTYETRGLKEDVSVEISGDDPVVAGDIQVTSVLEVSAVRITNRFGQVGDDVTIAVDVTNEGSVTVTDSELARDITLDVGGSNVPNEEVTLSAFNNTDQYTAGETNTLTFEPDSLVPVSQPGRRTVAVDGTDAGRIDISREREDLSLSVSGIQQVGEELTFRVTANGEPVDATVQFNDGQFETGSDGEVTRTFEESRRETVTVEKAPNATTYFAGDSEPITVVEPADIVVTSADVNTTQRFAGQSVGVTVVARNIGGTDGTQTFEVSDGDEVLASDERTLAPGERQEFTLTPELTDTGATTLTVGGETAGTVLVDEAVAVTNTEVPSAVVSGEDFDIAVTVEDRVSDSETGSKNVTIAVGGESESAEIEPADGGSETQRFTFNFPETGTQEATINTNDLQSPASIGEIDVSQDTEPLSLTTSPTPAEITAGESVTFTVTREDGSDADATVEVAGQSLATGDDGEVSTTIPISGNYTATATKGGTVSTGFVSASEPVNVSDPIDVTVSSEFTSTRSGPDQGGDRTAGGTQTRDVTIDNTGGRAVAVGGVGFTGLDADQYRITSSVPSSVAAGDQATITVAFEPTVRGDTDATLRFRTDTPRTPVRTVALNGTGESPDIEVNTTTLEFGSDLTADAPPVTETVEVSNDGNVPLDVDPSDPEDAFTVDTGAETIQPDSSQEYTVTFDPSDTSPDRFGDVLEFTTNDTFDQTVSVSLTATISQGQLSVSPTSADADEVPVDSTTSLDVVVSNTGTESIADITTTNETTSNGLSVISPGTDDPVIEDLGPGSQELVEIRLTQEQNADSSGANVTFVPTGDASDQTVQIDATPTAPALSVTPSIDDDATTNERDFGDVAVGSSVTRTFVVENDGDAPLQLTNVSIAGPATTPYSLPDRSGTVRVPAGEQRPITLRFNPQSTGTFDSSDLTFDWNDPSVDGTTELEADLVGAGIETNLIGNTSSVAFGTTGSGSTVESALTLTNDGNRDLTINRVTIRGSDSDQFSNQSIGETIAAGDDTTIPIEYSPTEAAEHTAEIRVVAISEAGAERFTATLQGQATPPEVQLDDTSLEFGFVNSESDASATQSTLVTNGGRETTTLSITDASVSGDDAFSLTNTPSQAGESATVEFNPDVGDNGELTGTLTIDTNDPDDPSVDVPLRGIATAPSLTDNRSGAVAFGDVSVGDSSSVETVGITNNGGAPANVTATSVDDTADFTLVSGFNGTLVPGETAPVTVRASPATDGSASTDLTVARAGSNSDLSVGLSATGVSPTVNVDSDISGDFGEISTSSSAVQTLSIQNDGDATLVLDNVTASTDAYQILGIQSSIAISPSETRNIRVAFGPTAPGESFDGTLSIETNDAAQPTITRDLSGTGGTADTSISTSSVDFGTVDVESSGSTEIELTNDGDSPLDITQVSISGTDSSAFDVTDFDSTQLAVGDTEAFNVSVSPTVAQSLTAQLTIGTGPSTSNVNVALGATGAEPELEVSSQQLTFDRTRLGATSTETLEVRNAGNSPLDVRDILVSGVDNDQFSISTDSTVVPAESSRTVDVRFTPNINETAATQGTTQQATLTLRSNDTDQTAVDIGVTAQSKTPQFDLPSVSRFGTLRVGEETTRTLEVSNEPTATADITIQDTQLIGTDAGEFDVGTVTPSGTLEPGDTSSIDVDVVPQTGGVKSASLLVTTNDPEQSVQSVSLSNSRTVVIVRYGSVTYDYSGVATTDPRPKASNDPSTGVIGIDPKLNAVTDFNMTFSTRTEAAGPQLGDDTSAASVRYLNVDTEDLAPSQHNETTVEFRVPKATISNLGSVEDGITLYQYDGSEYTAVETTRLPGDDTASEYAYTATIGSFGDLAIGAGQPDLSLTSATVVDSSVPDTLANGDSTDITVEADIENAGSIAGSDTVRVIDSSGATLTTESANVDVDATETVSLTVPLTGPGTRTLTVEAVGTSQDVTVDIDAPSSGGGGGPPSFDDDDDDDDSAADDDDDSAGGGAGDDGESPDLPASLEGVDVTATEVVVPQNISANQQVAEFETAANVNRITFNTTERINEVQVSDIDPANGTVKTLGSTLAVQDITVSGNSTNTSATIEFTIPRNRLDEFEATPEELRTFRTVDGEFDPLNTSVEETNETVIVTAETPGFSVFTVSAVSEPEAVIDVEPDTIQPGDTVELSATGSANKHGEITSYNWSAGGDTLTGETTQTAFDEAGEYTVELTVTNDAGESDTTTANLVVETVDDDTADDGGADDGDTGDDTTGDGGTGDDTTGDGDTDGDGTGDDGQTDDGIPGFGVLVALVALIAAAALAVARRP